MKPTRITTTIRTATMGRKRVASIGVSVETGEYALCAAAS